MTDGRDMPGGAVQYPDGKVEIDDHLTLIGQWGTSNCVADVTGDGTLNISDMLALIANWGPCACFPAQTAGATFAQTLNESGLTEGKWNDFVDVMTNGGGSDRENYNCWMQRYLSGCVRCPACPGSDPFAH